MIASMAIIANNQISYKSTFVAAPDERQTRRAIVGVLEDWDVQRNEWIYLSEKGQTPAMQRVALFGQIENPSRTNMHTQATQLLNLYAQVTEPNLYASLTPLLEKLNSLMQADEEDDYGPLRPTPHAFLSALTILVGAAMMFASKNGLYADKRFPRGKMASDGEGGVRVSWRRPDCEVKAFFPADDPQQPFLYHEEGDHYAVEENISAEVLASWLAWMDK